MVSESDKAQAILEKLKELGTRYGLGREEVRGWPAEMARLCVAAGIASRREAGFAGQVALTEVSSLQARAEAKAFAVCRACEKLETDYVLALVGARERRLGDALELCRIGRDAWKAAESARKDARDAANALCEESPEDERARRAVAGEYPLWMEDEDHRAEEDLIFATIEPLRRRVARLALECCCRAAACDGAEEAVGILSGLEFSGVGAQATRAAAVIAAKAKKPFSFRPRGALGSVVALARRDASVARTGAVHRLAALVDSPEVAEVFVEAVILHEEAFELRYVGDTSELLLEDGDKLIVELKAACEVLEGFAAPAVLVDAARAVFPFEPRPLLRLAPLVVAAPEGRLAGSLARATPRRTLFAVVDESDRVLRATTETVRWVRLEDKWHPPAACVFCFDEGDLVHGRRRFPGSLLLGSCVIVVADDSLPVGASGEVVLVEPEGFVARWGLLFDVETVARQILDSKRVDPELRRLAWRALGQHPLEEEEEDDRDPSEALLAPLRASFAADPFGMRRLEERAAEVAEAIAARRVVPGKKELAALARHAAPSSTKAPRLERAACRAIAAIASIPEAAEPLRRCGPLEIKDVACIASIAEHIPDLAAEILSDPARRRAIVDASIRDFGIDALRLYEAAPRLFGEEKKDENMLRAAARERIRCRRDGASLELRALCCRLLLPDVDEDALLELAEAAVAVLFTPDPNLVGPLACAASVLREARSVAAARVVARAFEQSSPLLEEAGPPVQEFAGLLTLVPCRADQAAAILENAEPLFPANPGLRKAMMEVALAAARAGPLPPDAKVRFLRVAATTTASFPPLGDERALALAAASCCDAAEALDLPSLALDAFTAAASSSSITRRAALAVLVRCADCVPRALVDADYFGRLPSLLKIAGEGDNHRPLCLAAAALLRDDDDDDETAWDAALRFAATKACRSLDLSRAYDFFDHLSRRARAWRLATSKGCDACAARARVLVADLSGTTSPPSRCVAACLAIARRVSAAKGRAYFSTPTDVFAPVPRSALTDDSRPAVGHLEILWAIPTLSQRADEEIVIALVASTLDYYDSKPAAAHKLAHERRRRVDLRRLVAKILDEDTKIDPDLNFKLKDLAKDLLLAHHNDHPSSLSSAAAAAMPLVCRKGQSPRRRFK